MAPKIVLFYPLFTGGGAEAVALWILEALKDHYDLEVMTLVPIDLARLNRMYETQVPENLPVRTQYGAIARPLVEWLMANSGTLRKAFLQGFIRYFKRHADPRALPISGYNAVDLGRPGVQYVHWVRVLEHENLYWLSQFSQVHLRANLSLANSRYTADRFAQTNGLDAQVIYPPVLVNAPEIPWEEKEEAFICSGRLTEAKQPHNAILVLRRVRDRGFPVKLHLTGGGGGVYGWRYLKKLKRLVAENADWVTLHEGLSYRDYMALMARCRYGLHLKPEPFGISVAEMMKTGAVPFVRDRGGQVEILGDEQRSLCFRHASDAADRISAVLADPDELNRLRDRLAQRRNHFSPEQFMAQMQQAVAQAIAQSPNPAP
ncbi:MAG: glycosyltransferase [Cyanobacteria bacterium]|nr:glycosyltransferase [Cyanobacteriota bacterium]